MGKLEDAPLNPKDETQLDSNGVDMEGKGESLFIMGSVLSPSLSLN